jgi:hypothetical protein
MWKGLAPAPDQRLVAILDLRPTQVTLGMCEVRIKRERWREKNGEEAARFRSAKSIPAVLGPDESPYIVDRHHLARALSEEGVIKWPVVIIADWSKLDCDDFWSALESRNWTHPFDDMGRRWKYDDIPKSIDDLINDPYRSLAGALKRAGAYKKDKAPFSEFRWANFLRNRIDRKIVDRDFDRALALAVKLADEPEAMVLPGFRQRPVDLHMLAIGAFSRSSCIRPCHVGSALAADETRSS